MFKNICLEVLKYHEYILKNVSPWQNIVLPAALCLGIGQIDLQVLGVLTSLESWGESWWGILTVFFEFVTEEKEGTDWRQIIPKLTGGRQI